MARQDKQNLARQGIAGAAIRAELFCRETDRALAKGFQNRLVHFFNQLTLIPAQRDVIELCSRYNADVQTRQKFYTEYGMR